ncbi:MAG: DUF819 family protein [Candidatus Omnitrophica bacterium]|nr:DUF819 family protein [Candidatus Omnitrophota bacterium]
MIKDPVLIVVSLLAIESAVLYVSSRPQFKKYFSFLPAVFWIYFIPMLFSTFGLIDPKAAIYQKITSWFLPASLVLLLLSSDIKAILRLGKPALLMMAAGSLGIMIGMPLVFALFKPWVGSEMWSGFGALSASWVGGSANMIAVKEAIGTPENVFTPMVVVDTIVPYVWMGFLVAASGFQWQFDRINESDRRILNELNARASKLAQEAQVKFSFIMLGAVLAVAVAGAVIARELGAHLPVIKDVLSAYAWTIIAASLAGIALSFSPVRSLEKHGATKIGYFFLYFVLTTIGAKAHISNVGSALILIGAGFLVVVFHAGAVLIAARLLRAPMFLAAVASQACIGGVASAPIVAEVYQPGLASVGLLLAILGNIVGTYSGIITAQLCRMVAG